MARYDMACKKCKTTVEVSCPIAGRESQKCATCRKTLTPLFSPPSTIVIPNSFRYVYSDLFGTSSEKEYLKANPTLERVNQSTSHDVRSQKKRERDKIIKEGNDVERQLLATGVLKKPIQVEAGSHDATV